MAEKVEMRALSDEVQKYEVALTTYEDFLSRTVSIKTDLLKEQATHNHLNEAVAEIDCL